MLDSEAVEKIQGLSSAFDALVEGVVIGQSQGREGC